MKKFLVTHVLTVALVSILVLSSGVTSATASAAAVVHHGIVPIGSTNEGGSGGKPTTATGLLDITAAPCVGIVQTAKEYESIPSRITLLHGSKVVARWEIYGEQRIAWVEPVGTYLIHSNQPAVTKDVRVVVSSSHVAVVRLIPGCL
jgi:hypothetical protein